MFDNLASAGWETVDQKETWISNGVRAQPVDNR